MKKTKEQLIEAIKLINITLLRLQSSNSNTRIFQGDIFTDTLIAQIKQNKEKYLQELETL